MIIDLLNQALGFGNGHDAVRRAAGKRIVSVVLAGARPCVVMDGRCGAPGSGKPPRDKELARAEAVNVNLPGADDPAFYAAGSVWFDRTILDDGHGSVTRVAESQHPTRSSEDDASDAAVEHKADTSASLRNRASRPSVERTRSRGAHVGGQAIPAVSFSPTRAGFFDG